MEAMARLMTVGTVHRAVAPMRSGKKTVGTVLKPLGAWKSTLLRILSLLSSISVVEF